MFTPENDLEKSLMKASIDPAHRPQFYKDLVASNVYVIERQPTALPPGETTLAAGTRLDLLHFEKEGQPYLPLFSSLPRLQATLREEAGYLQMNALELLKITRGAQLVLNPGSEYGKEFTPEEVASVLDGTLGKPVVRETEREEQVMLGQPKNYPHALVDALSRLFKTLPEVTSAYLAHFHNPSQGAPPHTLIALSVKGDWDKVVTQVGVVAQSVEIPDPPVDVVNMDGSSLAGYFRQTKPFYKRKIFGLF